MSNMPSASSTENVDEDGQAMVSKEKVVQLFEKHNARCIAMLENQFGRPFSYSTFGYTSVTSKEYNAIEWLMKFSKIIRPYGDYWAEVGAKCRHAIRTLDDLVDSCMETLGKGDKTQKRDAMAKVAKFDARNILRILRLPGGSSGSYSICRDRSILRQGREADVDNIQNLIHGLRYCGERKAKVEKNTGKRKRE